MREFHHIKMKERRSRNHMNHVEILNNRHHKKKNKTKNIHERKKQILAEYASINRVELSSKKSPARVIMELVEDIKESGMNDGRYLAIMDELMALNNSTTKTNQINFDIHPLHMHSRFGHYENYVHRPAPDWGAFHSDSGQ